MGKGKKKLDKQKREHVRQHSRNFQRRQKYVNMAGNGEVGKKEARKIREGRTESGQDISNKIHGSDGKVSSLHYEAFCRTSYSSGSSVYVESKNGSTAIRSLRYDIGDNSFGDVVYGNGKSDSLLFSLEDIRQSDNVPKRDGLDDEVREIMSLISKCRLKYSKGNV